MGTASKDSSPDNEVSTLFVWVGLDSEGNEEILASPLIHEGGTLKALISSSKDGALRQEAFAVMAAHARRKPARLVHFNRGGVVREIDG